MHHPVAIVIPTLNAGADLEPLLAAVQRQTIPATIIAVDSGSTDGTIERLTRAGARVLSVAPDAFNHGDTRNYGLSRASGEFAVLLVQDAVPATDTWLAELIAPFADPSIAGTYGRQQPRQHASRLTAHYLSTWAAARSEPRICGPLDRELFNRMTPAQRHEACAFDNVCSCVRLSVWRRFPFRRTPIAEDLHWAAEVLLAGHRIAYAPAAVVSHSHDRPVRYELQRTYLVHQQLQQIFGLSTIPGASSLVRSIASTLPVHLRIAATEPRARARAMLRGAALAAALPLAQYLGARSAREGRELLRVRGV
jgi:rhamnosyltransferase